jgi:acetyl-CoA C-acetyltransferase
VDQDQGLRASTLEGLAALKPVSEGGIHTAGNSSQISDGAAGLLWMTAAKAKELGLRPRARVIQDVVVGTDPYYLLDGPIDATREILRKTGMTLGDIDLYEVNEAFAAVVLSWCKVFEPDTSRLNVNGGAIALGHPIGATGAMLLGTVLDELEQRDLNTGLVTLCIGGGMGIATVIERL